MRCSMPGTTSTSPRGLHLTHHSSTRRRFIAARTSAARLGDLSTSHTCTTQRGRRHSFSSRKRCGWRRRLWITTRRSRPMKSVPATSLMSALRQYQDKQLFSISPRIQTAHSCQLGAPYPGGTYFPVPSVGVNPTAAAILSTGIIPHANANFGCNTTNPTGLNKCYVASVSPRTYWREELFRIDHQLVKSQQISFRYVHDSWNTTTLTPQWGCRAKQLSYGRKSAEWPRSEYGAEFGRLASTWVHQSGLGELYGRAYLTRAAARPRCNHA